MSPGRILLENSDGPVTTLEATLQLPVTLMVDTTNLPGASWFSGAGVPSDSLGADGDFYLDGDSGDVYAKENGTWA